MIESLHAYAVLYSEFTYNIKWTIISHLKHIVVSNDFNKFWEPKLTSENFIDAYPHRFMSKPIFGVEFAGERPMGDRMSYVFVVAYRGKKIDVKHETEWGVMSLGRQLSALHDSVILNFEHLSSQQKINIYDFTVSGGEPTSTHKIIEMTLTESNFETDQTTGEKQNGINWVYDVRERG